VSSYYQAATRAAYFEGARTAGRMAYMEATRSRRIMTASIAGAPFMDMRTLLAVRAFFSDDGKLASPTRTPAAKRAMVDAAIRASLRIRRTDRRRLIQNPPAHARSKSKDAGHGHCTAVTQPADPEQGPRSSPISSPPAQRGWVPHLSGAGCRRNSGGGDGKWTCGRPIRAADELTANEPWGTLCFSPPRSRMSVRGPLPQVQIVDAWTRNFFRYSALRRGHAASTIGRSTSRRPHRGGPDADISPKLERFPPRRIGAPRLPRLQRSCAAGFPPIVTPRRWCSAR